MIDRFILVYSGIDRTRYLPMPVHTHPTD